MNTDKKLLKQRKRKKVDNLTKEENEEKEDCSFDLSRLIPTKIDSKSTHIPISPLMEAGIILKHPFSLLTVGQSGSGKSNCIFYMIKNLYAGYFDKIILISPTGEVDQMSKVLNLKKENVITTNLISKTKDIMSERTELCKRIGTEKAEKLLVIFDDVSSEKKLMASQDFTRAFVALRHLGCSTISMSHKLRIVPRMCRLNANGLIIFPASKSEVKTMVDEYHPRGLSKKGFEELIDHAWRAGDDMVRPFLFLNNQVDEVDKFRRGFHKILKIGN